MNNDIHVVVLTVMINGSVTEREYYYNSLKSALQFMDKVVKSRCNDSDFLFAQIHKTYWDELGMLVREYESVAYWDRYRDADDYSGGVR